MAKKIWIACWDCGEPTQVPPMFKYQTSQICDKCKQERREKWNTALKERETNA